MQYTDILILTEIKLDDTFPTVQLLLSGFSKPCKLGRNRSRENVLIYICENIQSKLLDKRVNSFLDTTFWNISLTSQADILIIQIKHLTITVVIKNIEPLIESFVCEHELHNLVKKTCFKSVHNLTFTDLILANNAITFQKATQLFLVYQIFINWF